MGLTVTAKTSLEIEIGLQGVFSPGRPATEPTFDHAGDPPEDAVMEDVEITGITGQRFERATGGVFKWTPVDLLAGVDRKSEAYRQIAANVLAFLGDDAAQALFNEVERNAP